MPTFTINDPALPPSLHGPVLVDGSGRLRFWAAVASFESHGDLTPSTVAMRLSAIERLYVYAEGLWPRDSLDAIIARQDLKRVHDLLHGFFSLLRNSGLRSGRPSVDAIGAFFSGRLDPPADDTTPATPPDRKGA
jgi:hypothetical protein